MDICVCIPARDEAQRLPVLLAALAQQSVPGTIPVAIALNNTTDDSRAVIIEARSAYSGRLDIRVSDVTFPPALAHAGSARRLAMDAGLAVLGSAATGVLVSTDADTRPPTQWLEAIGRAFARGADLVGGRIVIDRSEPVPDTVTALCRTWDAYWQAVRAIEDDLDPVPWNPPPRHGDHTGASLAIRASLYRQCGGVPLRRTGEDRALVAAAVACGGRLAHPVDVFTHVSPRREGRADGGMAAAMQEMHELADKGTAPCAPSYEHWRERAIWRRRLRSQPDGQARIAREEPLLPAMPCDMVLEEKR
ncbi:glycosyl transferase family 2 [Novosphingobium sp. Leaf2]|nr:glycosyl transferase family 2 [Novosphingobium sp. Leaf2]